MKSPKYRAERDRASGRTRQYDPAAALRWTDRYQQKVRHEDLKNSVKRANALDKTSMLTPEQARLVGDLHSGDLTNALDQHTLQSHTYGKLYGEDYEGQILLPSGPGSDWNPASYHAKYPWKVVTWKWHNSWNWNDRGWGNNGWDWTTDGS